MQEATLQHSKSIKHRAVSPVQPNAKRLKQGTVASQPSESAEVASPEVSDLQSQNLVRKVSSDGHVAAVCATNLIADQGSTAQLTIPSPNLNINSFPNQESEIQNEYWYTDELDRSSVIYPSDPFNLNASLSYLNGADMNHSLSVYNSIDPSVMTDHSINSTQRVEVRSQPSDFLAIQDREGALNIVGLYRSIS